MNPLGQAHIPISRFGNGILSTMEAINRIARELQVHTRNIGYAGLKDKNAVTTQVLSVEGVTPERVLGIEQPAIEVLWAERHAHKLRVGHLRGNRFELTLRDIPHDTLTQIKTATDRLVTEGVSNRFGAQRFGNKNDSHLIGKALVKADWETLKCYISANDDGLQQKFDQKPAETMVHAMPHRLRRLYLSAYQAHLFNRVLEKRMPHLGKLINGDIAVKHSNGAPFLVENATIEQPRADAFEISPSGPHLRLQNANCRVAMYVSRKYRFSEMTVSVLKSFGRSLAFDYQEPVDRYGCRSNCMMYPLSVRI